LPEHPLHPRFEPIYESSFLADRAKLGFTGTDFDRHFSDIERNVCDYPWEFSREVPDSVGIRLLPTRKAFPDIPPMYVYYRVDSRRQEITFLGLGPAWSEEETFSADELLGE
jgi:hypothetical protein